MFIDPSSFLLMPKDVNVEFIILINALYNPGSLNGTCLDIEFAYAFNSLYLFISPWSSFIFASLSILLIVF